jgi:hypothetical protein
LEQPDVRRVLLLDRDNREDAKLAAGARDDGLPGLTKNA